MGEWGDKVKKFAERAKAAREEFADIYLGIGDTVVGIFPGLGLVGEDDYDREMDKKGKKVRKKSKKSKKKR